MNLSQYHWTKANDIYPNRGKKSYAGKRFTLPPTFHFYMLKRSKNLSNLSINTLCLFLYLTSEQTTATH